MIKESLEVILGHFLWLAIKWRYCMDYSKIALVLTGENETVDEYALSYLDHVIERKCAKEALVIVSDRKAVKRPLIRRCRYPVRTKVISDRKIKLIFKWHCLDKFYKNLIFTYVRTNQDNLLERFLNETEINEEDAVCLALYNLREIPEQKAGVCNVRK